MMIFIANKGKHHMDNFYQINLYEFGETPALKLNAIDTPALNAGEVLVNIHYSAINPIDVKTRAGLGWAAQQWADKLPRCLGYDAAGEIIALGEGVDESWLGKPVCGMLGFPLEAGCYGSARATCLSELVEIPKGVGMAEAAALPLAGLTAWQALHEHARIQPGESVLILGASGGVGHIALQLAKAAGCHLIALASSSRETMLQQLGADQVLDYQEPWQQQLKDPVDVLIDFVGGDAGLNALAAVKSNGRVITLPTLTAKAIQTRANSLGLIASGMLVQTDTGMLQKMLQLMANKSLSIEVQGCYAPVDIDKAHAEQSRGHVQGKLLLDWGV